MEVDPPSAVRIVLLGRLLYWFILPDLPDPCTPRPGVKFCVGGGGIAGLALPEDILVVALDYRVELFLV